MSFPLFRRVTRPLRRILLVAAGLVLLGLFSGDIMTHIIMPAIPAEII